MSNPSDLQPDDIRQLAEALQEAVPPLPTEVIERVHRQMQTELDRGERWQRRRRLAFGWSIAAAILLALGGYAFYRMSHDIDPQLVRTEDSPTPALVEDRISVAIGAGGSMSTTDKPLIRLDENRSLFTD